MDKNILIENGLVEGKDFILQSEKGNRPLLKSYKAFEKMKNDNNLIYVDLDDILMQYLIKNGYNF